LSIDYNSDNAFWQIYNYGPTLSSLQHAPRSKTFSGA